MEQTLLLQKATKGSWHAAGEKSAKSAGTRQTCGLCGKSPELSGLPLTGYRNTHASFSRSLLMNVYLMPKCTCQLCIPQQSVMNAICALHDQMPAAKKLCYSAAGHLHALSPQPPFQIHLQDQHLLYSHSWVEHVPYRHVLQSACLSQPHLLVANQLFIQEDLPWRGEKICCFRGISY